MKDQLKPGYLPHIDGLRALAVLAVIFFHFSVPGFGGGYIGVDIFFVISGFLITRLIIAEINATGRFSFLEFYKRRIRRLLPALFFVLLGASAIAALLFMPENLADFGASLVAATLSVSNILFWIESGYFDTASYLKPLLHTWSLSVEEQYYLLWPALMVLICKKRSTLFQVSLILFVGLMSFTLNHYFVHKGLLGFSSTIFFLAPFRVFEFSMGALGVYLIGSKYLQHRFQDVLFVTGVALILVSLLTLNSKSIFPYVNALAPCVGALFIILSPDSKINQWCFANKLAVGVGLISYSLYLVHWPVFVFAKYIWLNVSSAKFIVAMLVATFMSAMVVYYFVETRFRRSSNSANSERSFFMLILFFCIALCAMGFSMKIYSGWQWRLEWSIFSSKKSGDQSYNRLIDDQTNIFFRVEEIEAGKSRRYRDYTRACHIVNLNNSTACDMGKPIQILVFGNSHEPDGFHMLNVLYEDDPNVNLIVFDTANDCALEFKSNDFSSATEARDCAKRFSILNDKQFLNKMTHVFYSAHYAFDYATKDLWNVLELMSRKNSRIKTIAVGSYIATHVDCATLINKNGSVNACIAKEAVNYFNPNERSLSNVPQAKSMNYLYINKYELLCKNQQLESCITHTDKEPMFYDQHHLSYSFARYLGVLMWNRYSEELVQYGLPIPSPR